MVKHIQRKFVVPRRPGRTRSLLFKVSPYPLPIPLLHWAKLRVFLWQPYLARSAVCCGWLSNELDVLQENDEIREFNITSLINMRWQGWHGVINVNHIGVCPNLASLIWF